MIGATISPYRITEKRSEGGMGVVYKAEETKLERTVALRFLAGHLLNDEEAKVRRLFRPVKSASAEDAAIDATAYSSSVFIASISTDSTSGATREAPALVS